MNNMSYSEITQQNYDELVDAIVEKYGLYKEEGTDEPLREAVDNVMMWYENVGVLMAQYAISTCGEQFSSDDAWGMLYDDVTERIGGDDE